MAGFARLAVAASSVDTGATSGIPSGLSRPKSTSERFNRLLSVRARPMSERSLSLKPSLKSLFGVSLLALLFADGAARADLVAWSYNWTPGSPVVYADGYVPGDPNATRITMTNE